MRNLHGHDDDDSYAEGDYFNWTTNHTLPETYGLQEYLQTISIGILFFMSLIGNSLVLRYIVKKRKLHTATFILIANNCAVDLAITIFIMPMCFMVSILRDWPFNYAACQFFGFIDMTLYTGSLMALSAISVIRYFAIVCIRDKNYHLKTSKKTAITMIFICWFYSLAWGSFPLMGWNHYIFFIEKLMCNMNHRDLNHYTTASTICTTLVPCLVVIYCSFRIILAIRQHSHHNHFHQTQQPLQRSRVDRKVTTTLIIVFIAYCSCTIPQVVVASIYKWDEDDTMNQRISYRNIKIMATILYLSNCTVNPIIYGVCNKNLRSAFHFRGYFDRFFDVDGVSQGPTAMGPTSIQVNVNESPTTRSRKSPISLSKVKCFETNSSKNWQAKTLQNQSGLRPMSAKLVNKTSPMVARARLSDVSLVSIESTQTAIEPISPLKSNPNVRNWKNNTGIAVTHPRINHLKNHDIH
ncbi:uncharacterized protein TRIADDRAFT_62230 [Trichoplax adhaerens]|uniref:G-protein coupled receptors family 1 profile domain-containing protein n=1 Tax=Trichoplax adhaerens TaxID=10228 RepID=B3SD72_TRIAD|nr:hypothetical protein TRIADDRAFT_62230 [Trichoplax adhaerens]EDV19328.1 hypothetical protein TRIADDRAFT_62230 [Trichoplax adhaerens]|eukprot:XP_002118179.1 hypothetical protein TRIADDRAFT_62230 [Trichoplax adhaerens]